jgi:hypothetical protein
MSANQSYNHFPQLISAMERNIMNALDEGADMIADEAKLSMAEAKRGRSYKVSKTGKPHQASAPGEAPAIDTGALVNSIVVAGAMGDKYKRYVLTNQEYAQHLEFGTPGGKIAPRPFMRPAVLKKGQAVIRKLMQAIVEAINGAG